ncbi:tenascin-R [Elysia marginata]|uniref:Tenascin-R n=1 Tax=Elysia marginata TaxID=1093978 RepID=A0AAV4IE41_9GAST|nr:tenascin-R [Elysia marginata]
MYFCTGLELTLSGHRPVSSASGRTGCGVLLCEEVLRLISNTTPATDKNKSHDDTSVPQASILRMYVVKHTQQTLSDSSDADRSDGTIASLTPQHPRVARVSDGIKVNGHLTPEHATLRLELYKQDDCHAQYTCHVVQVDSQGRERVSTSRLLQQKSDRCNLQHEADERWSPAVAVRLLSLLQGMENKLTQLAGSSDNNWQVRTRSLEDRLEDKMTLIENRMEDKIASIENRFENKLDYFENRFEDKVVSFEKNVQREIQKVQSQLEEFMSPDFNVVQKRDMSQIEAIVNKVFDQNLATLKNGLKTTDDRLHDKLHSLNEKLDDAIHNTSVFLMLSLEKNKQTFNQTGQLCAKTLEETLTIADNINTVDARLALVNQTLLSEFQQIQTTLTNSSTLSRLHLQNTLAEIQDNVTANFQTAITDTLTLRECKKGELSVLPRSSIFPYPVVHPDGHSSLDFSYLCDLLTDGGGWIIIQRRTSGNVNFYRTWAEYKEGFGSLDDDFWLGNEKVYTITNSGTYELRVGIKYKGQFKFAHYSTFSLSDESSNYKLNIGTYDGTVGDSLRHHIGRPFTTKDRDNDATPGNCADGYLGAWWYVACHASNLNGKWGARNYRGPAWRQTSGGEPVSFTEMKIRLVDSS